MTDDRPRAEAVAAPRPRRPRSGLGHLLRLKFQPLAVLTDELFAALAGANPDLRIERTARGDLEIMAPAGGDSSNRNLTLSTQFGMWTMDAGKGLGVGFDSSGGFKLPDGATLSPDASWVAQARWDALTAEERATFPPVCPDFIAELRSRSDRPSKLRTKMREFLSQGVRLGWLIDPRTGRVEVYRPGRPPEVLDRPATLSGEDVLPGFVLDLSDILRIA